VKPCPPNFLSGFYWYGGRRHKQGRPPKWVLAVAEECFGDDTIPGDEDSEDVIPDDMADD
jgi:hypothetical protein